MLKIGLDIKHTEKVDGIEVDLLDEKNKIAIEIDGYIWHKDKQETDIKKNMALSKKGYKVIRIRQSLEKIPHAICYRLDSRSAFSESEINRVVKSLLNDLYGVSIDINYQQDFLSICNLANFSNDSLGFISKYPELAELLDPVNPPELVGWLPPGSHVKLSWICKNGHKYQQEVRQKCVHNSSCPYCQGNLVEENRRTDHLGNVYNSIQEMAEAYNIPGRTYRGRIEKGWSVEKALTTELNHKYTNTKISNDTLAKTPLKNRTDHLGNVYQSSEAMARQYGLSPTTLRKRLESGKSLKDALTTPVDKSKARKPIV